METGADAHWRRALEQRLTSRGGAISGERRPNAQARCLVDFVSVSVDYLSQRPLTLKSSKSVESCVSPHKTQEVFHPAQWRIGPEVEMQPATARNSAPNSM